MNIPDREYGLKPRRVEIRVIIAGGRDFLDYDLLCAKLNHLLKNCDPDDITVVSGTANGADKAGEVYAAENSLSLKQFPAEWDKYGKSAGHRRNAEMADYATHLVAFFDGQSRGTAGMIDVAKKKGLIVRVIRY